MTTARLPSAPEPASRQAADVPDDQADMSLAEGEEAGLDSQSDDKPKRKSSAIGAARSSLRAEGLRKPVETILILPKEGKLTLLVKRFFNVLLRHAQLNPVGDDEYPCITLGQLTKDAHYTSRDMEYLVEVLNSMLSIVVNWGDSPKALSGPKYSLEGASLLSYIKVSKAEDGPAMLEYDFHKKLRPMLFNPRVYAFISLEMNAKMSTSASLTLYEVGVRYLTNKDGLTPRRPWRDWALALTGNPDLSPNLQYKYFARDVLRPALNEVNDSQDEFYMEPLEGKVGRRVEFLQFAVHRKEPADTPRKPANLEVHELTVLGHLINLGVSQKTAEKFIKAHGVERVQKAIALTEKSLDKIKNVGGYLRTLLEDAKFDDSSSATPPTLGSASRPNLATGPGAASGAPLGCTPGNAAPADVVDVSVKVVKTIPAEGLTASLLKAYQDDLKRQALALFQEGNDAQQLALIEQFEKEQLEKLNVPLRGAWVKFRADWPMKKMGPFVAVPFKDWLIRNEPAPDAEALLQWAVLNKKVQLGDLES